MGEIACRAGNAESDIRWEERKRERLEKTMADLRLKGMAGQDFVLYGWGHRKVVIDVPI